MGESTWTKGSAAFLRRVAAIPRQYRRLYERVVGKGGGTRSEAIKVMCLECVGWEKKEVRYCTATACPLYRFRPYRSDSKGRKSPQNHPTSASPGGDGCLGCAVTGV
jgi:hypothetical protein